MDPLQEKHPVLKMTNCGYVELLNVLLSDIFAVVTFSMSLIRV